MIPINNATKWVIVEFTRQLSIRGYVCQLVSVGAGGYRRLLAKDTVLTVYELPESLFVGARVYKWLVWHSSAKLLESIPAIYYMCSKFSSLSNIFSILDCLINNSDIIICNDLESANLLLSRLLIKAETKPLLYLAHDIYGRIVQQEGYLYRGLVLNCERTVARKSITATLSLYDKFQFRKIYGINAHYIGLGPIYYLSYEFVKIDKEPNAELPEEYVLVFATKGLREKIFFPGEKKYALQNLLLIKTLTKLNYPIVIIGKDSHIVANYLVSKYGPIKNIVPLGYVNYKEYLWVLQKAKIIVLPLFGWRSGVSIKLLDALSYGNVVVTAYDAARAFPKLYTAPSIARNFGDLVNKVKLLLKSDKLYNESYEWLRLFRKTALTWDVVIKRLKQLVS